MTLPIGRLLPLLFCAALPVSVLAVPASITLVGQAVAIDTVRWSWGAADVNTTFTLLSSTGGVVAVVAGTASSYTEAGFPGATLVQRQLQQTDAGGSVLSPLTFVATPDASNVVASGSPAALAASDGSTRIGLSAGALPGPGQISISLDPIHKPIWSPSPALIAGANVSPPAGLVGVAASVREFTAMASGNAYTSGFLAPATLQIPYADASGSGFVDGSGVPVQTLAVFTIDSGGHWAAVAGSAVDVVNKVVTAPALHFSVYALFGNAGAGDLSGLKVFPNPWRPNTASKFDSAGIHFRGLTPRATIKVFTLAGDLVQRLEKPSAQGDEMIWDGHNLEGENGVSGVYYYVVTDPDSGHQAKGRLGIVR